MLQDYKSYLKLGYDFDRPTRFAIGLAIFVIGGILGFIYEVVFYWANSGFQTLYWRGGTFGPWIDTYCIASLLIFLILFKARRKPWLVLILSTVGCTLIQLLAGLFLYYFLGIRAWNYNLEILNFGNFGGFICVRTAVEFAVLGMLIMYVVAPLIVHMAASTSQKAFVSLWVILGLICIVDIVYNDVACSLLPALPGASDIYQTIGFKYTRL